MIDEKHLIRQLKTLVYCDKYTLNQVFAMIEAEPKIETDKAPEQTIAPELVDNTDDTGEEEDDKVIFSEHPHTLKEKIEKLLLEEF